MLVLTRKEHETIRLSGGIVLTVVAVKGKSVKIGIEAPENVKVARGEVELFEQEENRD